MRTLRLLAVLLTVAAAAACGSKNKKTTETPALTSSAGGDQAKAPAPKAEPGDTTPAKDPASLEDIIYFEFDSSDLGDAARSALDENAAWMKEDPKRELLIEGHTDETGTAEYNLGLGDRRARATKAYLVSLGIDEKRIKIITYGEERPASTEDAKNRRSVFVATKK